MSGPLNLVIAEISAGTPTLVEIAQRTGLRFDVVRAVVDHLIRVGRISRTETSLGCPTGSCGGCPISTGCVLPKQTGHSRNGLIQLSLKNSR